MKIALFCHSIISDWNHGNAHFLRGVATELLARGHEVRAFEPEDGWSIQNLIAEHGEEPVQRFHAAFPHLSAIRYDPERLDLDEALDGVSLALVHEWNAHELVARIGCHRRRGGRYKLLFHDTHHRSVTDAESMAAYDLSGYDGVLAFGEVIRERYVAFGWARRAWTWHEAADTRVFRLRCATESAGDVVWVGNWGDDERTAELHEYLLNPVRQLRLRARVHGVCYPETARQSLAEAGIEYAGWIANHEVPEVFGRYRATVHVPRGPYVSALPGIPTIRVFEALACGIPLISAPWNDVEGLFTPGRDFLCARDGGEMQSQLRALMADESMRAEFTRRGLQAIQSRHTCAHRTDELLKVYGCLNN
ncbi:MAG TPA: glycosyltransferase [Bryobacteraceae bacterium]|jgi:spore maturation protein CgeB